MVNAPTPVTPNTAPLVVDALIVGAGPTGLMLANWLTRLGAHALVVDGKSGPTRESRALIVQARSLEVYDQLGVGAAVAARGRQVESVSIWREGERVGQFVVGPIGAGRTPHPYLFALEQSQNEAILYEHLSAMGGDIRWQTTLDRLTQDTESVTATIRLPDGALHEVRAKYACGADGSHSPVRHSLGVPFEGSSNDNLFYVADVTAHGAIDEGGFNFKLGSETFLLALAIPGPNHFRLIGMVSSAHAYQGQVRFDDIRGQLEGAMGLHVDELHWFSSYTVSHRVAAHFRQGRVFLLGDAAHVHSPVGGQGMNTGLMDAHNLAWKLAAVLSGEAGVRLLDSYEVERQPFARSLVKTTDRLFDVATNTNALWEYLRGHLIPGLLRWAAGTKTTPATPEAATQAQRKAPFLPAMLFGLISQTSVSYPHSPLSRGLAGRVKGGDRLPFVPSPEGSNFDSLRDARPQVHVYGTPSPDVQTWTQRQNAVELKVFPYSPAAAAAGLQQDAVYLVRPDGYVGLALSRFATSDIDDALRNGWDWTA
jgi:2-polyprenyl-6-methoxyphenol hydroxylase-like FAD-dependent oxidoreductase